MRPAAPAALNGAERSLLDEMNRVRGAHGLVPLRVDATLQRAARAHTVEMLRRQYFGHDSPGARLRAFGARGPIFGENLGWGVGAYGRARLIVRQWLASPPHRANLLRRGFRRVGLASIPGTFAGFSGARVVTADFAGR